VTSLSWIVEKGGIRWGKERKDLLGVRSLLVVAHGAGDGAPRCVRTLPLARGMQGKATRCPVPQSPACQRDSVSVVRLGPGEGGRGVSPSRNHGWWVGSDRTEGWF